MIQTRYNDIYNQYETYHIQWHLASTWHIRKISYIEPAWYKPDNIIHIINMILTRYKYIYIEATVPNSMNMIADIQNIALTFYKPHTIKHTMNIKQKKLNYKKQWNNIYY